MKKYLSAMLVALSFGVMSLRAQPVLSVAQLKAYEGYYRSSQVKDLVVHIVVQKDTLVAKPQWVEMTVHLLPKADMVFHSIEAVERAPIDITFSRGSAGGIGALDLGNGVKWNREKDYKAVVKKEMTHTPEQLKPYEGVYRIDREGGRFLQFFVRDNKLILKQVWDGTEIPFSPENEQDFFTEKIPLFSLRFTKDQGGNVTQVLAFGRDLWIKTKQPDLSQGALGVVSGKYRSKDDPDNQIAISVRGKDLVVKQLWDGQEIVVQALTDLYFYNQQQSYNLAVRKDGDGKVNKVVLLENSVFERVP